MATRTVKQYKKAIKEEERNLTLLEQAISTWARRNPWKTSSLMKDFELSLARLRNLYRRLERRVK